MISFMLSLRRLCLTLVCLLPILATAPAFAFQSYFINREAQFSDTEMFPKWTGMLSRYHGESHKLEDICGGDDYSPCKLKGWKDFLIGIKDKPIEEQMDKINRFVNSYPYVTDIANWGVDNYWETPYEFQKKSGNCKDYAIAKFMSLRALGVTGDVLRVVVVQDLNLGGVIHAVLMVYVDDDQYILDNQIKQVVPAKRIYHYVPIYSINERHWWQYFVTR